MNRKEQLKSEIKSLRSHKRIFVILGFSFLTVAVGLAITSIIVSKTLPASDLYAYFAYFASMSLSVSLTMFILSTVLFTFRINARLFELEKGPIHINENVVNEKPKEKTKEEMLLEQYENLLHQGYITQEDFEKKKEELTPKKNG